MTGWWRAAGGGIAIDVRLTPRADGRQVLHVRVTAPPDKGTANAAL